MKNSLKLCYSNICAEVEGENPTKDLIVILCAAVIISTIFLFIREKLLKK